MSPHFSILFLVLVAVVDAKVFFPDGSTGGYPKHNKREQGGGVIRRESGHELRSGLPADGEVKGGRGSENDTEEGVMDRHGLGIGQHPHCVNKEEVLHHTHPKSIMLVKQSFRYC